MNALDTTVLIDEECIATPDDVTTDVDIISAATSEEDKITYKDSTYEIVSKVAYLIGVPKRIFDNRKLQVQVGHSHSRNLVPNPSVTVGAAGFYRERGCRNRQVA